MQRAIGNETRFRILYFLTEQGAQSAKELAQELDLPSNTLHYHLELQAMRPFGGTWATCNRESVGYCSIRRTRRGG
ncbi:helix-turn-helix domain-containing protein [Halomicroarcula limicola]|uniref:Helix-turn-helix domain-containing protein n=1 Tax=Haloarcula limicola TaxID=1429915 RepID=A0A8J7YGV6_9EURY|nr:helix-turn-helix domain-containing protein [Halomicroarcula limicola]MBV0926243.1 helix-turn-helix domain-containing protein [Halomicroarcula limicola]